MSLSVTLDASALAGKLAMWRAAAVAGLKVGVADAAALVEADAKDNAPVLTGRLRDGIHTETVVDTEDVQQLMITPVVAAENKEGFDPPYARRIEMGFVGQDSLGRHYHQAAQPYMRPAYDNRKDDAAAAIHDGVTQALQGVA